MLLKNYQNKAIKKLLSRSKELLEQRGERKIVFIFFIFKKPRIDKPK